MTEAEQAYSAAEEAVEEAARTGADRLSFDTEAFSALDRLPAGIGQLGALRVLVLDRTQVSDLTPLAGLTGLKMVRLIDSQVSDLKPLAGLTGLTVLSLINSQVSDLTPLTGLTGLTQLVINGTPVSNLSLLAELTGLTMLTLDGLQVSDLRPLARLTGLMQLSLSGLQVSDVTPLAGLTGLKYLSLSGRQVSDLRPLAGLTGLTALWLYGTQVGDLTPLAELTALTWLDLSGTQVSDLTPLAGLTGLTTLGLYQIAAIDLRPLRGLVKLAEDPIGDGLTFRKTPATRADPRIAEIAGIEDAAERARTLFAYLENWVPPVAEDQAEAVTPDPLLRNLIRNGKLDIETDAPTEAESKDRVKRSLHERLRKLLPELARLAGNQFPRLAARARALTDQIEKDFADIDLLTLHLEIEDLEDRREKGTEDGAAFSEEVSTTLKSVTNIGPGLTLDHEDVEIMLDRRRRAREENNAKANEAKHNALSNAIIADPDANSEKSREMEELLERVADRTAAKVLQEAKHKNLIYILGTAAVLATTGVAYSLTATLIANAFGANITAFVQTNWALLLDVAGTYGSGAAIWLKNTVGPLVAGLDTTVIRPVRIKGKPKG